MDLEAIRLAWESGEMDGAARSIYDALPTPLRPSWAADILELACSCLREVPREVRSVVDIGRSPMRHREAHDAFSAVRDLTLVEDETNAGGAMYSAILVTAENAAKTIYNGSGVKEPIKRGEKAPFDEECGYWLVECLSYLARLNGSPAFKSRAWNLLENWLHRASK